MSPPSWTSLPFHPSRLSQSLFDFPESYSKFPLAIYFTYGGVYVFMLLSHFYESFFENIYSFIYLFIWLHQVLAVALRIFSCDTWVQYLGTWAQFLCSKWDLNHLIRDGTCIPCIARQILNPWSVCLVTQSSPTLCDPIDYSLPGSFVHGDSPGKNTGVGFHALLQGIVPTQGSNLVLSNCRWNLYHLSHQESP